MVSFCRKNCGQQSPGLHAGADYCSDDLLVIRRELGSHPWLIVLICVLITISSMMIGVIVALVSKSAASASALMQGIIIAMTFISGGFTPIAIDFVQRIGEFTVNHWALQSFLRMMLNASMSEIMHNILMLGVVSAVLLAIAAVIYGRWDTAMNSLNIAWLMIKRTIGRKRGLWHSCCFPALLSQEQLRYLGARSHARRYSLCKQGPRRSGCVDCE